MKSIICIIILLVISAKSLLAQSSNNLILESLKKQFPLSEYDQASEIIKFNQDTILVAGYLEDLSDSRHRHQKKTNIIYKTINRGNNWRVIKFDGDAWIYDTYYKKDGKVWMVGSDNLIHYSNDFGETWKRKKEPFQPISRALSIFMVDSLYGIVGGLSNGLAITKDNWSTSIQIESPLDQKRFKILKNSARSNIPKLAIVDSVIFINQNDYIFYSKIDSINWKRFNIPVIDFKVDEENKEISLESRNGKYFVIKSNLELVRTYQEDFISWTVPEDTSKIDLEYFLNTPIKSIEIITTNYDEFDRMVGLMAIQKESSQKAKIYFKKNQFYFKSKGYKKKLLDFTLEELNSLLNNDSLKVDLAQLSKYLIFNSLDFENYKKILENEKNERKNKEKWGGNFTSQISLKNPLFKNFEIVTSNINQKYLTSVYNAEFYPFSNGILNQNSIQIIITNQKQEKITISNKNVILFSLPWTITYKGKTIQSFNPKITKLVRKLIPEDFENYDMLLGGELIYKLVEEKIIDDLEYRR